MSAKSLARNLLPPVLTDLLRRVTALGNAPEWEYVGDSWPNDKAVQDGWNDESVASAEKAKWSRVLELTAGAQPLGLAHEALVPVNTELAAHNNTMILAYVLALSARQADSISILDWGGGLGHHYVLARSLMEGVEIDYHCKDVPRLAEAGRELLPEAHFYEDEDECFARSYDLVMANNSLQYSPEWRIVLSRLAASARKFLLLGSLQLVTDVPSFVVVQRPHKFGYLTEYMSWQLNREEFFRQVTELNMRLVREFLVGDEVTVPRAPAPSTIRSFLLCPQSGGS